MVFNWGGGGVISTKSFISSKSPLAFSKISPVASDLLENGQLVLGYMI